MRSFDAVSRMHALGTGPGVRLSILANARAVRPGALKIIAAPSTRWTGIDDPPVIVKILSHLGLPTRGPPRAPARRVDLFQTI